jgi:hypothetical protein
VGVKIVKKLVSFSAVSKCWAAGCFSPSSKGHENFIPAGALIVSLPPNWLLVI